MDSGNPLHLLDVLNSHNVPFVVIGGHAVTYHGFVRATEDTDVIFQRTPRSESALLRALAEVHANWIGDEIDPETGIERLIPVSAAYIRGTRTMMLVTDFGFLDVFDYVPGLPELSVEELFASALECGGHKYVALPLLRAMKAAANRPKDRADLENLPNESGRGHR
ncbi:MAG: hypothetical protein RBS80_01570 [Thermoguttaceae bacterium]|jgi:hypothetical protein|nr:hypothetical protein [Thermoguttaceae bacterium]